MKRFFVLMIACIMIVSYAVADNIDLSSLSFDELRELQTKISKELTTRPEWKEVPVPPGIYKIGEDIPVGDWCLKCDKSVNDSVYIRYGTKLNETNSELDYPLEWFGIIAAENDGIDIDHLNIKTIEGYYIEISGGTVLFTSPEKVSLGF